MTRWKPSKITAALFRKSPDRRLSEKDAEISGNGELKLAEDDFQTAYEVCKGIKCGRRYLFCYTTADSQIFRLDTIIWAYSHATEHRKNGSLQYTSYKILLYKDNGKPAEITAITEEETQKIMRYLHDNVPGLIVGYTSQLMSLFLNHYDEFLRIRREGANESGRNPLPL